MLERPTMLHHFRFIFLFAILVHYMWSLLLFVSPSTAMTTPISQTVTAFGRYPSATIFLVVATAALCSIMFERDSGWLLLPQAAVLLLATAGGLHAVFLRHYADGVPRPWEFILADQFPTIALAIVHLFACILVINEAERRMVD